MIRILCVLTICFVTACSFSQQEKQDSLTDVLFEYKDYQSKKDKISELILTYENKDDTLYHFLLKAALEESEEAKDIKDIGHWNREISIFHRRNEAIDSAFVYANKALSVFEDSNNEWGIHLVKSHLGLLWDDIDNYPKAIENYTAVISYFEKNGGDDMMKSLTSKMNLATLYQGIGDCKQAQIILKELYDHPLIKEDNVMLSGVCVNLMNAYRCLRDYEGALKYGIEAEKINKKKVNFIHLYSGLGSLQLKLKNYKKANEYYRKDLKLSKELDKKLNVGIAYHNIGNNYLEWGKYKEAEHYLLKANFWFEEIGDLTCLIENYKILSNLNKTKNNYVKAFDYSEKQHKLADSILGINKQKAIENLKIKYETDQIIAQKETAEAKVKLAEAQSKQNKTYFISSGIIASIALIALIFYFARLKTRKKAELVTIELRETQKRLAIEKQYRDSELKALKAQMNPHFIFNALNSIQEYIILNQKNLAGDYLGKFADLIRTYLHHSDAGFITVEEEIESLQMYLELEALRFEDTLSYSFDIDKTLKNEVLKIPTMLIQPYIENALKHGLLHRFEDRELRISFSTKNENTIVCVIKDNGVGRKKADEIKAQRNVLHKSFATKATENRLQLLNFGKDRKIGVTIEDLLHDDLTAAGTKVTLNIPTLKN